MERVSGGVGSSATRVAWIKLLSLSFANIYGWRRGWDSNPRAGYPTRRFRGVPVTTTSVPLRAGVGRPERLLDEWSHACRSERPLYMLQPREPDAARHAPRRVRKKSCTIARHSS